jgi:hypothetical protein
MDDFSCFRRYASALVAMALFVAGCSSGNSQVGSGTGDGGPGGTGGSRGTGGSALSGGAGTTMLDGGRNGPGGGSAGTSDTTGIAGTSGGSAGTDAGGTTEITGAGGQGGAKGGTTGSAGSNGTAGTIGAAGAGGSTGGAGAPGSGLWSTVSTSGPPAWSGPTVTATVAVTQSTTVGQIGPRFVGLSYEKSHLTDQFFTAGNAPLIALCKMLGPSMVRIGGNSVDRTTWQPMAPAAAVSGLSTSIGTADVDGLADFLRATGWTAIYGINLKTSTPQAAAAEATYAAGKLTSSLDAFEIGNEPDLYGQSYATWSANFESFGKAIRSAVPNAALAGPATAGGGLYEAVELAHDDASQLTVLTQHYYRGSGKTTSPTSVTMADLLALDTGLISTLKQLATAANSNHISGGYRLAETNSFFAHGAPGVSDAFGSALWAIDFLFENAENGSGGVNFHGGGAGQDGSGPFYYTPINEMAGVVTGAQPIFYGMLLFASAGIGPLLESAVKVTSVNFTAYAVGQSDGSTNVVLVNKDNTDGVATDIAIGKSATAAYAVFLEGPSVLATTGVTFAGAAISQSGQWNPSPAWTVPITDQAISIVVPPASAVLIHVR